MFVVNLWLGEQGGISRQMLPVLTPYLYWVYQYGVIVPSTNKSGAAPTGGGCPTAQSLHRLKVRFLVVLYLQLCHVCTLLQHVFHVSNNSRSYQGCY